MEQIARTTLQNGKDFEANSVKAGNEVKAQVQADLRASIKKVRILSVSLQNAIPDLEYRSRRDETLAIAAWK